jgi:3,4-dihydroxy 2-butanone 4-phosphate synthase/GTP cyclohydrolase II
VKRLRSKAGQGTARSARSAHGKVRSAAGAVRSVHGAARIATPRPADGYATVEEAIADIAAGRFVIVVDDEDRENEGDLTMAAEKVTPEAINFMARFGRGLICMPMTEERLRHLDIPLMVQKNTSPYGTAFCVSIEARDQVSTGISAADRARTVLAAIHPKTRPSDLTRPGHMFPLRAQDGGVLKRAGQTEAAIDLARLAGLEPAGVICEIMNEDGTMARQSDLEAFSARYGIKRITIADLISYRMRHERLVRRVAQPWLPTKYGRFRLMAYRSDIEHKTHLALVLGHIKPEDRVLVRVHSECITGDVFGSMRCDCGPQLQRAMEIIAAEGKGVIVYLRQEGRGIGLLNKLKAYELQDTGHDTVEANEALGFKPDLRNYGIGAQILLDLGLKSIRVLTNNPKKLVGLEGYGLSVVDRIRIEAPTTEENAGYLATKVQKLGHLRAL